MARHQFLETSSRDFCFNARSQFKHQMTTSEDWTGAFRLMFNVRGGQFSVETKDSVQVVAPAFPPTVMRALVETVLGARLEPAKTMVDVLLFRLTEHN